MCIIGLFKVQVIIILCYKFVDNELSLYIVLFWFVFFSLVIVFRQV